MAFKKLEKLLNSSENKTLEKLLQRAQSMDSLTSGLRAQMAPEMAENLIAANLHDGGELVLMCSTSAWASRMRFEADEILAKANESGIEASVCRVRVRR